MPILTFPSIIPTKTEWQLISNTQHFVSPLNGTVQTLEMPGARWGATLTFTDLEQDDARTLMAFLTRLRGGSGRFYLYDHSLPNPRGIATGTPLVAGASQVGATLVTDGWTISTANILKPGDYIGVNDELKMVVSAASANSSGIASVLVEPPLRSSPADNAVITVTKPKAVMMLVDDKQTSWSNKNVFSNLTLRCVEAFS